MANFNKVIMAGNLTRYPELRYTPGGSAVCEFGIAVNRTYSKDGEEREETCFVDVHAWGGTGEAVSEYCTTGDPVLVEGRLSYDTWETPEGRKSNHFISSFSVQFLDGASDSEQGGGT